MSNSGRLQDVMQRQGAVDLTAFLQALDRDPKSAWMVVRRGGDFFEICDVDDNLCALTGFERNELVGQAPATLFFGPEMDPNSVSDFGRNLLAYEHAHLVDVFRRKDQTTFTAHIAALRIADPDPGPPRYLYTVTRLTRDANATPLFNATVFDATQKLSDLAYWRFQFADEAETWSSHLAALLGLPTDVAPELRRLEAYLRPADAELFRAAVAKARAGQAPESITVSFTRQDGVERIGRAAVALQHNAIVAPVAVMAVIQDVTDIEMARDRLRLAEQRTRTAIDAAGVGVLRYDVKRERMEISPKASEMLRLEGYAASWPTDWFTSRLHPDDFAAANDAIQRQRSGQQAAVRREMRLRCEDGVYRWFELRLQPADEAEETQGPAIHGVLIDIDTRRRAEQALADIRERYALALEASEIGLWDWDLSASRMSWSSQFRRILGLTLKGPATWDAYQGLLHPDERDAVVTTMMETIEPGQADAFDLVHRLRAADGRYIWVQSRGRVRRDEAGTARRVAGAIQDVSARKVAELELARSEQRLQDVVAASGELIFELDANFRFTYLTDRAMALLGHRPEAILGKSTTILAPPGERAAYESWRTAAETAANTVTLERCVLRGDGDRQWLRISMRRLTNERGRTIGYRGAAFDISQQKAAEREILNAKSAAEGAAEDRAKFLATMSHEIRTPLNAVIGMTDILLRSDLNEELHEYAQAANKAGRHLLTLVNDILDYSKLDAGKVQIEAISFDLETEIRAVCDMLVGEAARKNLAFDLQVMRSAKTRFIGDPARLRQVLVNLVSNAIKFTGNGRVSLRAGLKTHSDTSERLRLEVEDTGIGIREEALPLLFRDFSQADAGTTRRFGGTGLGLAICRRLVELMGGEIGVQSEEGKGSLFWVEVPFPKDEAQPAKPAPALVQPAATNVEPRRLRVLAAEDNPANQLLLKALFARFGHQLVLVGDGAAAVEAARKDQFDVILMDVEMPVVDGVEATREIRRLSGPSAKTPIIALTAHAMADHRARFKEAGMDDVLAKPFEPEKLAQALEMRAGPAGEPGPGPRADAPFSASPLVDRGTLDPIIKLAGADAIRPVIQEFWSNADELVEEIETAVRAQDATARRRAAHTLKGAAANVGARRAADVCKALETTETEEAAVLIDALRAALAAARPELETILAAA
ncbi:MAG: PAS domain S-box protein [Maricaulaceae bacterium]